MKTILKTIVAFLAAAVTPVAVFFAIGFVLLLGRGTDPSFLSEKINPFEFVGGGLLLVFWTIALGTIFGGLIFQITSLHVVILGVPAFLVGLRFKAIRWWSTLIVAFMIGAIPTTIFVLISEWSDSVRYPNYYPQTDFLTSIMMAGVATGFIGTLGGLFGISGGLAFWLVWRFWVQPDLSATATKADVP